jgi:hypothetical protein
VLPAIVLIAAAVVAAACSSSTPNVTPTTIGTTSSAAGTGSTPGTVAPATNPTGTMVPVKATVTVEREVSGAFRQGLAHVDGGWVFSTNWALYRTDDELHEVAKNEAAIPDDWVAKGYNHIGDIDIVGNTIYAPVEQPDTERGRQAMFRFDATTLQFLDGVEVAQHHNSFVSVDPDTMIAFTTDYFDDEALLRYDIAAGWKPLAPIAMSRTVGHIQGGDLAAGAFWLATDDEHDGVYRVDLATGDTIDIGSIGHVDGEGEGIDATSTPNGLLHIISIDAKLLPVRLVELSVGPS